MARMFSAPGLPESFNVLIKELQSLGLQVDLFRMARRTSVDNQSQSQNLFDKFREIISRRISLMRLRLVLLLQIGLCSFLMVKLRRSKRLTIER